MDKIEKNLLEEIADIHEVPEGAYNIRANGKLESRNTTANIDIVTKKDKPGIDIIIKPGTVNESVHIPVILSESGLKDLVYNDFYIGEAQMLRSWRAAGSTTAEIRRPSMTASTPSILKRTQRYAISKSITVRGMERATAS